MSDPAIHIVASEKPAKPWLLLAHGVSQNHRLFSRQIDTFQSCFNLLLVDLPGHGQSSSMSGPFGLKEFARSLATAQEKAGIEQSHFLGTHLGAGAGLLLATEEPSRIQSLLLEAPVLPGVPLPSVTSTLNTIRELATNKSMDVARLVWFQESAWFDVIRSNPGACRAEAQWEMISEFSGAPWLDTVLAAPVSTIEPKLPSLNCPTLVVNGEYDLDDFKTIANRICRGIPDSQQATIPGGGGFPLWEYPEHFNQIAMRFYREILL